MDGQKVRRDDLKALRSGHLERKQTVKHFDAKLAKLYVQREKFRSRVETRLRADLAGTGLDVTELEFIGGNIPLEAWGSVTYDGQPMRFYFRFRGDFASLEVGYPDPEEQDQYGRPSPLVEDAVLVSSRADVTGEPYESSLPEREVGVLLASLFKEAHPPATGERYRERLAAALDAALEGCATA